MDPDPSSLYSLILFAPHLNIFSAQIIFFTFIAIGFLGYLSWLNSAERVLTELDKDSLEAFALSYPSEFNKLSKLYNQSNRLSTVFAISRLLVSSAAILSIYTVVSGLVLDFFVSIGVTVTVLILFVWYVSFKTYKLALSYLHMTINVVYPVLKFCLPIANLIAPEEKEKATMDLSIDELKTVLQAGEEEQPIIANLNLYRQVLRFDKIKIRHVMRPKREFEGIKANYNFREVIQKVKSSNYSRLLVYDGNWTNVHGIIHCKDLLPHIHEEHTDWKAFIRPLIYVQEKDNAQAVLKRFQQSKNHMALVQSASKRLVGLVTLEDITEEIIGEIEDE